MALVNAAFSRDGNGVPITTDGLTTDVSKTFTGDDATVNTPLFRITGSVEIRGLWGVVTTDLGANQTAASWRLNDQTAQIALTAVGGTTISGLKAGSMVVKKGVVATALTALSNAAGAVSEPTTLETMFFSPFVITKKTEADTDIEWCYTTTDDPTSGVIQFFCRWIPLSADGAVEAV